MRRSVSLQHLTICIPFQFGGSPNAQTDHSIRIGLCRDVWWNSTLAGSLPGSRMRRRDPGAFAKERKINSAITAPINNVESKVTSLKRAPRHKSRFCEYGGREWAGNWLGDGKFEHLREEAVASAAARRTQGRLFLPGRSRAHE